MALPEPRVLTKDGCRDMRDVFHTELEMIDDQLV